jgi:glyoxylase-like metal-dependent hydrolase (beta-lactamase superfamily II)
VLEITGIDQQQAWKERRLPPVEQVSAHVWSVPVPCAPFPVRFTYSYLAVAPDGRFVVIDPGLESDEGADRMKAGIAEAGLSLDGLVGIAVTHFHPDHLGAAQSLADETGAWLGLHAREIAFFDPSPFPDMFTRDRAWLSSCGFPQDVEDMLAMTPERYAHAFSGASPDRVLADGDRLELPGRDLEVVWTPGHTAGHVCIVDHDDRLVFTGDHVLPRITPNIGVDTHDPDRDGVAEYESSLLRVASWPDYEACPAHEYRFRGIPERAEQLQRHQSARSAEVAAVLAEDPDAAAWDVARQLTWARGWDSLDGQNLRSAVAETQSHLNHLRGYRAV